MSKISVNAWHGAIVVSVLVGVLVALWPLGLGHDYMNHLARTYIEGHLHATLALQKYYALSFDIIPDLTMDLIIPWLSQIIGIYAAGAVTVWLAFILPPLAGVALARHLHGRVTWMSLIGFLTVFNANMNYGFVNYNASIGLALLVLVVWMRMPPGWRRSMIFAPVGLALVINHALAFLVFGYLALVWEGIQFSKGRRGNGLTFVWRLVSRDGLAMAGGVIFLALSVLGAADLPRVGMPLYDPATKIIAVMAGTLFGETWMTTMTSAILLAAICVSIRNRWIVFASDMGWLCAAVLILIVLMPTTIFGIWGLHFRFTALLLVLIGASIRIRPPVSDSARGLVTAFGAGVLILTVTNGALQMKRIDQRADAFRQLVSEMPSGSKLLVAFSSQDAKSAFSAYGAAIAVIDRQAFIPGLFTNTSPVDVTPNMAAFHMPQNEGLLPEELRLAATQKAGPSKNGFWSTEFANDWPNRWDYLVLFRGVGEAGLADLPICEVAAIEHAVLYKVGECD